MSMAHKRLSTLQADMAFFDARLSLAIGSPDTSYQRAQIKTYRLLGEHFSANLAQFGDKGHAQRSRDDSAAA
jgi:hypothetical protein